eukprot:NODE_764_length_4099_cov_0.538000.p3 type:complete len:263 gc:universal NODE_764_length_4099_cov_0.538000:2025-1237(-)
MHRIEVSVMCCIHALNPHIDVAAIGDGASTNFGKNPTYSMQQIKKFRTILLKDFDFAYYNALVAYQPEFVPTYKLQFEQYFDTSLLKCNSIFISSKNAIKALLHHHVNKIENKDVYIVGPKTAQYFEDCFNFKPRLVGNSASHLIEQINDNKVKEPILFLSGKQFHDEIPKFISKYEHSICPMYSVEYIINEQNFAKYTPNETILIIFSPEIAKRIPNSNWLGIICIGETTQAHLRISCLKTYSANEPTANAIQMILNQNFQ